MDKKLIKRVAIGAAAGAAVGVVGCVAAGGKLMELALMPLGKKAPAGGAFAKNMRAERPCTDAVLAENTAKAEEKARAWLSSADVKQVSVTARDGLVLRGEEITVGDGHGPWVVLVHGYRGTRAEMYSYAARYAEWGFSVLLPDLRCHGKTGGEYVGMGWADRYDIISWVWRITAAHPNASIVLHGHSMGGSAVLMAASEWMPENVRAIVSDCAVSDTVKVFGGVLKRWYDLPSFPIINIGRSVFKMRGGYDINDASALKYIGACRTPVLFIHGAEDKFVPTDMSRELYAAAQCEKELVIIEGAGHVQSQHADPELYYSAVKEFLKKYGAAEIV